MAATKIFARKSLDINILLQKLHDDDAGAGAANAADQIIGRPFTISGLPATTSATLPAIRDTA